jgi:hypothetical protein
MEVSKPSDTNLAAAATATAPTPPPIKGDSPVPLASATSITVLARDDNDTPGNNIMNDALTLTFNSIRFDRHVPEMHLVNGRARHSQSQGGVERFNCLFKEALQK